MGCPRTPRHRHRPCLGGSRTALRQPRLSAPPRRSRGLRAPHSSLRHPVFPRAPPSSARLIPRGAPCVCYSPSHRVGYSVLPTHASILSQPLRTRAAGSARRTESNLKNQTGKGVRESGRRLSGITTYSAPAFPPRFLILWPLPRRVLDS